MSNKEIRQQAWEICKGKFPRVLAMMFVVSMISLAASLLGAAVGGSSFIAVLPTLVLLPILEVGTMQFVANLWHGEYSGMSVLFQHANRFLRLWGIELIVALIALVICIPAAILGVVGAIIVPFASLSSFVSLSSFAIETAISIATLIAALVLIIVIAYVMLRLSLVYPAFIMNPERTAKECIRTSWTMSKGNVKRIFCNTLILNLPLIIAQIMVNALLSDGLYSSTIISIIIALFEALFTGYIALGEYGLAEQLLTHRTPEQNALPSADSL